MSPVRYRISMVPLDAIDPDAAYCEWVARFLWDVDQLPALVETTGTIALAVRGACASQLTERITGGGFYDNVPLVDGPESRNARAVWDALRSYLIVASSRLGLEAPGLPAGLPDDVELAREWAFAANAWPSDVVYEIRSWPDLDELEEQLFRLIRRARSRLDVNTTRRARSELCTRCGEVGVTVDWIDGPEGPDGPDGQACLSRVSLVCRTTYTPAAGSAGG